MSVWEARQQFRATTYVREVTQRVVQSAQATTRRGKVLAIRDYIRTHVTMESVPRPLLRASAADILRSGKGACGEASRVFICMTALEGIPAQRVYLDDPMQ